jgi:hypothetical protein
LVVEFVDPEDHLVVAVALEQVVPPVRPTHTDGEFHDQADDVWKWYHWLIVTEKTKYALQAGRPQGVSVWPFNGPVITIHLASAWSWNSPEDVPLPKVGQRLGFGARQVERMLFVEADFGMFLVRFLVWGGFQDWVDHLLQWNHWFDSILVF